MIRRVLVANRGEIAVRIAQAVDAIGAEAVMVYATDESTAPHVAAGAEAVALAGRGPAAYLDLAAMVTAAVRADCDALHPGYGFLSEDPRLAAACRDADLAFVGPSPSVLERFGDKTSARRVAAAVGVPVARATGVDPDADAIRALRDECPDGVIVKAVAGGGGRGQRHLALSADDAEVGSAIDAARREAAAAFGDGRLYVEERIVDARHVEVQVVGDGTRVEHLWERDCTVQRRGQKLIEVAPAVWTDATTRLRLRDAAVAIAESVDLRSLATVEFLVTGDRFVFLEVNPRLQVEHTVTESITGLDLVVTQLRLAGGASLSELGLFAAPDPAVVAVQCRLNAEVVRADGALRPATGTVETLSWPPGQRVDHALAVGAEVTGRYDTLVAKVVVSGADGPEALSRAAQALEATTIGGVGTNRELLQAILARPEVGAGETTVDWLDAQLASLAGVEPVETVPAEPRLPIGSAHRGIADEIEDEADTSRRTVGDRTAVHTTSSPMTAVVLEVLVAVGDRVVAATPVAVVEAMKMEHVLAAGAAGTVTDVVVAAGDSVVEGDTVVVVAPSVEGASGSPGHTTGDATADTTVDTDDTAVAGHDVHDRPSADDDRPDLALLRERLAHGLDEQRPDAVAKRHGRGGRTARENVADLVDDGSFLEYGALTVAAQRSRRGVDDLRANTPADGMIGGLATIDGHPVAVASYDYMVLAGTQGYYNHLKKDRLIEVALERRLPFVFFTEGGGGRPGDTDTPWIAGLHCRAFETFARLAEAVPTVAIVHGRCFAGNAAIAGMCDLVIATEGTNLGMGGPAMIEGGGLGVFAPEDIGPLSDQTANDVVDVAVADEAEAVSIAQRYLRLIREPRRTPDVAPGGRDPAEFRDLRSLVPENRRRVYDMRAVVAAVADVGSVLEVKPGYGRAAITAFARVDGHAVGIIANDPGHLAGAIDTDAARKLSSFLARCQAESLPVVSLCDTPGFMVGPDVERTGLVRAAGELFRIGARRTVPLFVVVTRRGYGLGAQAMAGGSFHAPTFTVAWPSGEFGGMGLEGAVRLGYRKELAAIDDPAERERTFTELVDRMYDRGRAVHMAEAFEIDAVIDPADTRRWLSHGLAAAHDPRSGPGPDPAPGGDR